MQIKTFNNATHIIYVVVSGDFVYENKFAIEIDTCIKTIEQNKK